MDRRFIVPAVVGVSAAATLVQFIPGAAAATPQTHGNAVPSQGIAPDSGVTPMVTPTGCSESSSPDYGCGKITVEALPVDGTFPTGETPTLSGLVFEITGPTASNDTVTQGTTAGCTLGNDSSSSDSCQESYGSFDDNAGQMSTWVAGGDYSVALVVSDSTPAAPADTLIPAITGTFPDCTAYQSPNPPTAGTGCPDTEVVHVYGTYRELGLNVVSSLTHKGVAGATYALCSTPATPPTTTSGPCPSGTVKSATATSGAGGTLVFASRYLGGQTYTVVPAHEPHGYETAASQRLVVPAVTNPSQAGTLLAPAATLVPIKTTIKTRHLTTTKNKRIGFNAFAGAKSVTKPLTLGQVVKPHHGSAHHSKRRITYKPRKGYVGKDRFSYTVRNGVGVKTRVKVIVRVRR